MAPVEGQGANYDNWHGPCVARRCALTPLEERVGADVAVHVRVVQRTASLGQVWPASSSSEA